MGQARSSNKTQTQIQNKPRDGPQLTNKRNCTNQGGHGGEEYAHDSKHYPATYEGHIFRIPMVDRQQQRKRSSKCTSA